MYTSGYATASFPGDLSSASLGMNQLPLFPAELLATMLLKRSLWIKCSLGICNGSCAQSQQTGSLAISCQPIKSVVTFPFLFFSTFSFFHPQSDGKREARGFEITGAAPLASLIIGNRSELEVYAELYDCE